MTPNLFKVISKALWQQGADEEELAADMAEALADIISEGIAAYSIELTAQEFKRLLELRQWARQPRGGSTND